MTVAPNNVYCEFEPFSGLVSLHILFARDQRKQVANKEQEAGCG